MDKDKFIDSLWERSNHGTEREDLVEAFDAGVAAERIRCASISPNGLNVIASDLPHQVWGKYRKGILNGPNDGETCMFWGKTADGRRTASVKGNSINLCRYCANTFPECPAIDVVFGDGDGNDNVAMCASWVHSQFARW